MPTIAPAIIHYDDAPELDDVERGQVVWSATPARVSVYEWSDKQRRLVMVDKITGATVTPKPNGTTEITGASMRLGRQHDSDTPEQITIVVEPTKAGCCG